MKSLYTFKARAPSEAAKFEFRKGQYRQLGSVDETCTAIILALLVGIVVMWVSVSEMYDKCGSACWQGLVLASRERH